MTNSDKIIVGVDSDLEDLIPGYLENRKDDIQSILEALQDGDYEKIRLLAHSMKGSGGGYGFVSITDIGKSIETAAVERNDEEIKNQVNELSSFLDRVEVVFE